MTDAAPILDALRQLEGGGLPARAARRARTLVARLGAPVRIALFGLPGSGKAAVLNALAGAEVLPPQGPGAPLLLRHAGQPGLQLTGPDGQIRNAPATTPLELPPDTLFAELGLPLAALERFTLLDVVTDGAPDDMAAGLGWAAARCDMAIWCTRRWTALERDIWWAAPHHLQTHALLAATEGAEALEAPARDPAGQPLPLCPLARTDTGAGLTAEAAARLAMQVAAMIDEARGADMDAAAVLLAQFPPPEATGRPEVDPTPPPASAVPVEPPVPPEARAVLARLFQQLRQGAEDLAREDGESLPHALPGLLDGLRDMAEAEHSFAATWPDLDAALSEASELALLMQIEARPEQAVEGALLLAQLRREMETELAA
ncbi:hypothetical protein [Pseudoponticoccus marisrubri]|uniref:Uncharacterized protein n=1 Tax=Pseudoponticoccus marisrubri TaxID=1685382 RepID=A0A0W7WKF3_9RHOB|nr:hypothetical protein [Pseudoponticoccus marisrubri]KUF11093.1 hypothetical protein AVJ23_08525 [Pseudoponticoccus marisrubri]